MMSEVRIRPRQVLVLLIVFLVVLMMVHRKRTCQGPEYLQAMFVQADTLPTIYAVTPTYPRPAQKAELTRLSHLFMLMPHLHWIIVEDTNATTSLVRNLLKRSGLEKRSTQLNIICGASDRKACPA
ncbi:galactosylgalactosylxylosylprotein 3-beta-glucuronosyltransferase I-like [Drosophila ficusphila]|uniref:galactosylgalactosylxylosylprotein 3-beta-glucuronosyltransferase I-like n=1 Tax=Drosophila ficusphila TaxID=30025 RepID=UPI0007E7F67F|nr:galactosylgalactosylxylosylprotein 3-beta-glucuronosyltransferase I-like [Drosophila ficusphila]